MALRHDASAVRTVGSGETDIVLDPLYLSLTISTHFYFL